MLLYLHCVAFTQSSLEFKNTVDVKDFNIRNNIILKVKQRVFINNDSKLLPEQFVRSQLRDTLLKQTFEEFAYMKTGSPVFVSTSFISDSLDVDYFKKFDDYNFPVQSNLENTLSALGYILKPNTDSIGFETNIDVNVDILIGWQLDENRSRSLVTGGAYYFYPGAYRLQVQTAIVIKLRNGADSISVNYFPDGYIEYYDAELFSPLKAGVTLYYYGHSLSAPKDETLKFYYESGPFISFFHFLLEKAGKNKMIGLLNSSDFYARGVAITLLKDDQSIQDRLPDLSSFNNLQILQLSEYQFHELRNSLALCYPGNTIICNLYFANQMKYFNYIINNINTDFAEQFYSCQLNQTNSNFGIDSVLDTYMNLIRPYKSIDSINYWINSTTFSKLELFEKESDTILYSAIINRFCDTSTLCVLNLMTFYFDLTYSANNSNVWKEPAFSLLKQNLYSSNILVSIRCANLLAMTKNKIGYSRLLELLNNNEHREIVIGTLKASSRQDFGDNFSEWEQWVSTADLK